MQQSLAHLFVDRVNRSKAAVATKYKENRGPYRELTWGDFGRLVREMSYGLVSLGLNPKDCAAVMSTTSHLWVASDLSIINAGAVSAPIYPTSSSSDIEHILNNSQARIAFVYNETLLNRMLSVVANTPKLEKIVLLTAPSKGRSISDIKAPENLVIGLEELLQAGRDLQQAEPRLLDERIAALQPDDLATIIYTSGTTGTPKGVMLTHRNILTVVYDLPGIITVGEGDVFLSFLPLSHVFERVCGEFYWLQNGACVAFAEGIEHVARNMQETSPTIMLVVPRILDKIYAKVSAGIAGASGRRRRLIEWSIEVGKEVQRHLNEGRPIRKMLEAKFWLAEKLVLSKLREKIGPKLRLIVSGGAPATAEVIEFFNAVGITVLEGYGLTETAAPTNVNRVHKNKFGTVGPVLPSVQVKVAEDGEVLFKGPSIFTGYYRHDEMTREVFTDGWFHSGDIGVVDSDGYLKITDRKKDIIVNSAGKNIAPQKVENVLRSIPLISQAIVFGDKKKTLVALLTLDEQATTAFAGDHGWQYKDFADLLHLPELRKHLKNEIHEKCKSLADYERVFNFAILPNELSVERGELTATLKVKRNVLKVNYKDLVESLYKEESSSSSSALATSKSR
ncbi:MAG: long-chain fatty acid--CoA ligase [Candidatus Obscuribacterales bacterium]|nr:long-chain fatty acid--CoA ligase [Candidatus Obscuribacterales bacterium]